MNERQAGVESGAPARPDDLSASESMGAPAVADDAGDADDAVAPDPTASPRPEADHDAPVVSATDDGPDRLAELPPPPITVIAVHGNGGSSHRFSLAIPQMPADVQMVAVTLPGFGGRPADPSLRSLRDYARNLGEIVARSPRPRVLLGHGVGGSIALQLAQRQDIELDGLILHAPVGAHLDSRWLPWIMAFPRLRSLAVRLFTSQQLRPIVRWSLFSRAVPRTYVDRFIDEYGTCSVFGDMFDIITPEWFGQLRPVTPPSALVWGMAERLLPVEHINAFKFLTPGALVLRVPGWGHFPMAEAPRSYADEVADLARALVARSETERGVPSLSSTPSLRVSEAPSTPTGQSASPESART